MQSLTTHVIFISTVNVGYAAENTTEENLYKASWQFIVFETLFVVYLGFELLRRFGVFRSKRDWLRDGWCKFDTALV